MRIENWKFTNYFVDQNLSYYLQNIENLGSFETSILSNVYLFTPHFSKNILYTKKKYLIYSAAGSESGAQY